MFDTEWNPGLRFYSTKTEKVFPAVQPAAIQRPSAEPPTDFGNGNQTSRKSLTPCQSQEEKTLRNWETKEQKRPWN